MPRYVRIGNAQAFWGDRTEAAAEMLSQEPDLDFLTLDYLAEVSLSILALQRDRDPRRGYACDFVDVVRSLAPYWNSGGTCRLITNAGGLNPEGCAAACAEALAAAGCRPLRIAVVAGDDVLAFLRNATATEQSGHFANLDTHAPLTEVADRLVTANAYVGADPLVTALDQGAEILITGRVADPSLTVAACRHHFGWGADDWSRLANATIAGHLIECGVQVTGGISTDWMTIPDPAHIGFPIVEVADDGSCVVTKPRGSGGVVSEHTVREQLLYEIGDPGRYLSPDVTVSFLSLQVQSQGPDRVRVSGAVGSAPPNTLKVSATYADGFRAAGVLAICGEGAVQKAQRAGRIVLQRVEEQGHRLRDSLVECLSAGTLAGGEGGSHHTAPLRETMLRIAVESDTREALEQFSRELMPLITAGPPGTTGYSEGRPRVHPLFRYWPCVIDRERVRPTVTCLSSPSPTTETGALRPATNPTVPPAPRASVEVEAVPTPVGTLAQIALARSGDKGIHANIGVLARDARDFPFLQQWLTAERVRKTFAPLAPEDVVRYEVPNLHGLNFVLKGVLRRGLRTDAQGKALAQELLSLPLPLQRTAE